LHQQTYSLKPTAANSRGMTGSVDHKLFLDTNFILR